MPASSYSGPVRILDMNGVLLTISIASLETDEEQGTWTGIVEIVAGSGAAGKALEVMIEIDGHRGRAQLLPKDNEGTFAHSRVVGLGPQPF